MKKIFLIKICISLSLSVFSQKGNIKLIKEYEDTLKIIANKIMNAPNEKDREIANNAFIKNLNDVLKYEKSFNFPFDSLKTISKLKSPDKLFRIFSWILKKENGTYNYYGIVHYHNKKRKRYELINLEDKSNSIRNPEQADLDNTNWFGGLYYKIIYIKKKGRKYYTLLSYDLNDNYSNKKIIDIMYFAGKEKIKFGLPVFKKSRKKILKRVILEYDSRTMISVKFDEINNRIVYDHLVPIRKDLEGLYEYYIPEGTFNAYNYNNGKWWLEQDVDIRNLQKYPKIKKIKKGLIPK